MSTDWPRALKAASGPIRKDKLDGAILGMGQWGAQMGALSARNLVTPDMMTGLTLFILGHQPRGSAKQEIPGAGGGVAGGVWVRERHTIVQPLDRDDAFSVIGESVGRHVHKGRRYGTNRSETRNAAGELVARNLTTGLLAYKVEDGLADMLEGENPDLIEAPGPDWTHASENPHQGALRALNQGQALSMGDVFVSLKMMEVRDTKKPDNPIHSDPELARKAGLEKPLAGGSHVLAFPMELIMSHCGPMSLLYGAAVDARWKVPVYADTLVHPKATVRDVRDDLVVFDVEVVLDGGAVAMVGTVQVPLA